MANHGEGVLKILCAATLTLVLGCSDAPNGEEAAVAGTFDHASFEPVLLHGELLAQPPEIGGPWRIEATERHLWVADSHGDPGLHVLDRVTGEVLFSTGRKGEGPGEFASYAGRLQRDHTGRGIWAYDPSGGRFARFRADDSSDPLEGSVNLPTARILRAAPLGSEHFIGVRLDSERFAVIDSTGSEVRVMNGEFPGASDHAMGERQRATMGVGICSHPEGSQFVLYYSGFGQVEIYDSAGARRGTPNTPFPTEPMFEEVGEGRPAGFVEHNVHYIDCTTTSRAVLLIFSGADASASLSERMSGQWVHVLDWGGALLGVYKLSHPITGLAVAPDGAVLYGASYLDAGIYAFPVPEGAFGS